MFECEMAKWCRLEFQELLLFASTICMHTIVHKRSLQFVRDERKFIMILFIYKFLLNVTKRIWHITIPSESQPYFTRLIRSAELQFRCQFACK